MGTVKHIFMTGEGGFHNLGDEGMALASIRRLKQYFPEANFVATGLDSLGAVLRHQARIIPWPLMPGELPSNYPLRLTRKIAQKLGASEDFMDPMARSFDSIFVQQYRTNPNFRAAVAELEQSDFVFDMGHGGLTDVFNPFPLCYLYYLCGRLRKPLFISGQTVGPVWRGISKRMIRETLPNAHTVCLRDRSVSAMVLTDELGLSGQDLNMVEVGDDVLDLPVKEPDWRGIDPALAKTIRERQFFTVQWRNTDYTQTMKLTSQLLPLIAAIEVLYHQTGLEPIFVPTAWEPFAGDVLTAAQILDYFQDRIPFHVVWSYQTSEQAKWLLGQARFGIGKSYHFHVFALSQGVPTIGFYTNDYYRLKQQGVFKAYGYRGTPLPYVDNVHETPAFLYESTSIQHWTADESQSLKEAAESARLTWHNAFSQFISDNRLA